MATLAAPSIPAFDGDIVVYAVVGVAALVVGVVLLLVSSRFSVRNDEVVEAEAPEPPRPSEPSGSGSPLQARSAVVERLRADVRRWGKPS